MTKTKQSPPQDQLVTELLNLAETAATNGVLASSSEVLRVVGEHTDITSMTNVRQWLAGQTDNMPTDEPGRDKAAAIAYILGLTQGTLAWSKTVRFKRAAASLDMKRQSVTQKKDNGYVRLNMLASEFARVIESAPISEPAVVRSPARASQNESDGVILSTPQAAYHAAITEVQAVCGRQDITIDVVSLRSSFDARTGRATSDSPPHVDELHDALIAHVEAGGYVRRLVSLRTLAQLEDECQRQERLREKCETPFYELRAYVMDPPPGVAPLVIEGECALLGMSDQAAMGVRLAYALRSAAGIDFCSKLFQALWTDSRARWLTTLGHGISPTEITALRNAINVLTERREADLNL